jgi:hypothetical protein
MNKLDGNWLELEYYIKKYIPKAWVLPIANVAFTPMITSQVYEELKAGEYGEDYPWYVKEAIASYFEKLKEQEMKDMSESNIKEDSIVLYIGNFLTEAKEKLSVARKGFYLFSQDETKDIYRKEIEELKNLLDIVFSEANCLKHEVSELGQYCSK